MMLNHSYIYESLRTYLDQFGFTYIEVPWLVPEETIKVTFPSYQGRHTLPSGKALVGSAEHGFYELMTQDKLEKNTYYIALTPCFREDRLDELHQEYFMKLEMFCISSNPEETLRTFIKVAGYNFVRQGALNSKQVIKVKTSPTSYDLLINGIEVGSYAIQEHSGYTWICGTAMAEPRYSTAINQK